MTRVLRYGLAVVLAAVGTAVIVLAAYIAYLVRLWTISGRREQAPPAPHGSGAWGSRPSDA
jgi:hypothetical protein